MEPGSQERLELVPTSCAAGSDFTATTLSRFYAIHMLIIPGLTRR